MGAIRMPSAEEISRRYKDSTGRVAEPYKRGVQQVSDWQERAVEGQGLYEQRMQDPTVLKRRAARLQGVSNESWRTAAAEKGTQRIAQGMVAAVDKQRRGYSPFRDALAAIDLPARSADPMANVDNRLKRVVQTLVDVKRAQS